MAVESSCCNSRSLITRPCESMMGLGIFTMSSICIECAVIEGQGALRLGESAEIDQSDGIVRASLQAVPTDDELSKNLS